MWMHGIHNSKKEPAVVVKIHRRLLFLRRLRYCVHSIKFFEPDLNSILSTTQLVLLYRTQRINAHFLASMAVPFQTRLQASPRNDVKHVDFAARFQPVFKQNSDSP
jgi:hypothetical protein